MAVTRSSDITLAQMQALATLANGKLYADPPFEFSTTANNWLTELNRIRYAAGIKLTELSIPDWKQQISGPWPISRSATAWANNWFKDAIYYYPEAPSVSIKTVATAAGQVGSGVSIGNQIEGAGYECQDSVIQITIGGTAPVTFRTGTKIRWLVRGRNLDDPAPAPLFITDMPGIEWQNTLLSGATEDSVVAAVANDITVAPGTYYFTVACSPPHFMPYFGNPVVAWSCEIYISNATPEETPGLHTTKRVMKLEAPQSLPGEKPFGLYWDPYGAGNPALAGERLMSVTHWEATNHDGGFWTAKTAPIPFVDADLWQVMPPNSPGNTLKQLLAAPSPEGAFEDVAPAIEYRPARFPICRDTDSYADFQTSSLIGYWLHDIILRRAPEGTIALPVAGAAIAAKVGCLRNGTFASWEDQNIPAGLLEARAQTPGYPVFSKAPARYQSASRLVPYAQAIHTCPFFEPLTFQPSTGEQKQPWWTFSIAYPISAAHYNDTEAALNLL